MKKKIIKIGAVLGIVTLLLGFSSIFISASNTTEGTLYDSAYTYTSLYFPDSLIFSASSAELEAFTIDNYTSTLVVGKPTDNIDLKNKYGTNRTTIWMRKMLNSSTNNTLEEQYVYLKHNIIEQSYNRASLRTYFVKGTASSTTPQTNLFARNVAWTYNDKVFTGEALNDIQQSANNINFKQDTNREGFVIILSGDTRNYKVYYVDKYSYDVINNVSGQLTQKTNIEEHWIEGVYREDKNNTAYMIPWVAVNENVLEEAKIGNEDIKNSVYKLSNVTVQIAFYGQDGYMKAVQPEKAFTNTQLDFDGGSDSSFMQPLYQRWYYSLNKSIASIEDNNWGGWIGNVLSGIWNFRILPFATLGTLISTLIGIAVVMAFLRMFHA